MSRCITGVLTAAALFSTANATEFYRQDPQGSGGGLSSQDARNPGGLGWFAEGADNFPAQAGWSIGEVGFWGGYASPLGEEGNTEGFTIRFYTDNFGSPGTLVFEQDVFDFTREQFFQGGPPLNWAGYEYSVQLDPPFVVPATEEMWMSVVAILPRGGGVDEPQWGWVSAAMSVNPPFAHQWFFNPGNFTEQFNDVSFVLSEGGAAACPADLNGDGVADADDFFLFLQLFADGDTRADINGDGVIDADDFFDYLVIFAAGC